MGGDTNLKTGVASCTDPRCTLNIWCTRPDGTPAAGLPYKVLLEDGCIFKGNLNQQGHASHENLLVMSATVELGERVDESELEKTRKEIKATLDEIIKAEQEEYDKLEAEFAKLNWFEKQVKLRYLQAKGFFQAGLDLLEFGAKTVNAVHPIAKLWRAHEAAWKTYNGEDDNWFVAFHQHFTQAEHEAMVKALGFDPSKITKDTFVQAYEIASHIYEDEKTRDALKDFAVEYAKAQHVTEYAEFSGGIVFEIVLTALLAFFTAGVGAVAANIRHVTKFKKLGKLFKKLGELLKKKRRHKIDTEIKTDHTLRQQLDKPSGINYTVNRTKPSKAKGGKPRGERAPETGSQKRKHKRENESADTLADAGYDVDQGPHKKLNGKEPDYKIEGEYFDCLSPDTNNVDQVRKGISKKVNSGQTDRIVLNLDDTDLGSNDITQMLQRKPKDGLKEVIGIKNGKITQIYP